MIIMIIKYEAVTLHKLDGTQSGRGPPQKGLNWRNSKCRHQRKRLAIYFSNVSFSQSFSQQPLHILDSIEYR